MQILCTIIFIYIYVDVQLRMMAAKDNGHNAKSLCTEHNCEFDYYCDSCEESLCMCCALTKHTGHRYGTVEQVVTKHKGEIQQTNVTIEKIANTITETHEHIIQTKRSQSDELDEIDRHYEEQIRNLMERKEQAKAQFRDQVSKKEEAFVAQQKELEIIQKELRSMKRLNKTLENSCGKEMDFTKVKKQKQVIYDCMQEIDAKQRQIDFQLTQIDGSFISTIDFMPFKQSIFNPAQCELLFPESLYNNSPVVATLCTKDSLGKLCAYCRDVDVDDVCVELESFTGKVVRAKIENNYDGSYKANFTPQHMGKAKVVATINGQHVKGSPYYVSVNYDYTKFNITNIDGSCIGGGSKQPWGIAIGGHGIWAITDNHNHCVYLLSRYTPCHNNQYQIRKQFGSQGNGDGQFENPHGVAFDGNNNLYVVDGNNHRIQKFDTRGNYLLQFGNKGTGVGQLSNPRGISICNGRVYVADSGNKRVAVFLTTGWFCHNIGEQLLGVPCDVTVNNNTLLVAVYGQNYLNAFTLDGQSKGQFGTLDSRKNKSSYPSTSKTDDSNIYPFGLTTDLNDHVILSETCSRYVEIFDRDGNLVKSFGPDLGSVQYPLGVAVTPEGRIKVVSAHSQFIHKLVQDNFPIHLNQEFMNF